MTHPADLPLAPGGLRAAPAPSRAFDASTAKQPFVIVIAHPMGPLFGAELRARLKTSAPGLFVRYTTRSRPVDLALDLRSGIDMAVDWLRPDG